MQVHLLELFLWFNSWTFRSPLKWTTRQKKKQQKKLNKTINICCGTSNFRFWNVFLKTGDSDGETEQQELLMYDFSTKQRVRNAANNSALTALLFCVTLEARLQLLFVVQNDLRSSRTKSYISPDFPIWLFLFVTWRAASVCRDVQWADGLRWAGGEMLLVRTQLMSLHTSSSFKRILMLFMVYWTQINNHASH